mmetsp:Transcript_52252/g.81532  ORF Transcript_52252/g.81532 Transcript_52252/m.81532 type:complete len:225 (+) Transcript_52252:231-905(+)
MRSSSMASPYLGAISRRKSRASVTCSSKRRNIKCVPWRVSLIRSWTSVKPSSSSLAKRSSCEKDFSTSFKLPTMLLTFASKSTLLSPRASKSSKRQVNVWTASSSTPTSVSLCSSSLDSSSTGSSSSSNKCLLTWPIQVSNTGEALQASSVPFNMASRTCRPRAAPSNIGSTDNRRRALEYDERLKATIEGSKERSSREVACIWGGTQLELDVEPPDMLSLTAG